LSVELLKALQVAIEGPLPHSFWSPYPGIVSLFATELALEAKELFEGSVAVGGTLGLITQSPSLATGKAVAAIR
jgi:hypothetical protein